MNVNKYFYLDESPIHPGKYVIKVDTDLIPFNHTTGSLSVLPARLMHLNWAEYLRMCRDVYKADIVGKNSKYPVAYFTDKKHADLFIQVLNGRMECILRDRKIKKMRYDFIHQNLKNK